MVSEVKHCAECGAPLPPRWPKGLCNQCALDRALVSEREVAGTPSRFSQWPDSTTQDAPFGTFGDYELLEEIARGGMGVVYRARQKSLGRIVAVKMILGGPLAGAEFVHRFRTEASAAAILQHPNIVAIHDVGVHEGRHYFSMDYVEGQNLAQVVGQQPLPPAQAARYLALIAEAIHYAHQRGILHRDLKPSNVLIDVATDQPRVTDFGLAKRLNGEATLTVSGQVLGSPNFMPPEQAGGARGKMGAVSDVYALGGILYYLLTARAPFQADSLEHVLTQVLSTEPVAPRLLDPSIPKDLETIALKCLEKEPSRRYQSARELAEELNRYLRHEPIRARPLTPPGRLWRWCRRKPVLASLAVLLHVVGFAGLTGILWQWQRAERHARSERQELYAANMNLAQHEWEQNRVSRVRDLLEETATSPERGFEWFYWQRQLHLELQALRGHTGPILAVAYSHDGRRIVTGSADMTARVWEADTGKELFSLKGHTGAIRAVVIFRDGRRILTGSLDGTVGLWDALDGKLLRIFFGHRGAIVSVALSPDEQRMVTGSQDGTAKVWEIASGDPLVTFTGHSNRVWAVSFSPDGQHVVSGAWDGTAKMWEAATGKEIPGFSGHRGAIFSVAFSPDGRRVVTGSQDHTARVWDAAAGMHLQTLRGHSGTVFSVGYSLDGRRILTASEDQTARLWDSASGDELAVVKGHGSRIGSAALSPDGRRIVTGGGSVLISPGSLFIGPSAGDDQTAKVWDVAESKDVVTLAGHSNAVVSVSLSPDGQLLASSSFDGTAIVWDMRTVKELRRLHCEQSKPLRGAALLPDRRRIIAGSFDGSASVWDITNGQLLMKLEGHTAAVVSAAVSPDGRWIATCSWDQTVRVWDAATGRQGVIFRGHAGQLFSVAFSPDSRRIISADGSGVAKVWDPATGKELLSFRDAARIWAARFSNDGRRIVTGGDSLLGKVWDAVTGKELVTLRGHTMHIHAAVFSPDGRRIVTGSADQTAKLWDAATGKELLTFKGHSGWVFAVVFSPDGQRIVTASGDSTIKIWEAASLQQVQEWRAEEQALAKRESEAVVNREQARAWDTPLPGGINKWLVLLPISYDGNNGVEALGLEQVARESQLRPRHGDKVLIGSAELGWREAELTDFLIDFNQLAGRQAEFNIAYAACYLESETSQSNLILHVGSDDQSKIFLNGREVYRTTIGEGWIPDRDRIFGIELSPGLNVLVYKVVNERGDWKGSIRITDGSGNPVKGLRVTLTPP